MTHHSHFHCSEHDRNPSSLRQAFLVATLVNGLFVIIQLIFAYMANSASLFADATHNLGDVLGLMLAGIANQLLKRLPTERTTYGMKKISILAAMANGVLLVFTCGIIATEAMYKLLSPTPIHSVMVMVVAGIGILVNGATAALFLRGENDLNVRGAFLHLFYDALISASVLVSAILLSWTQWLWIDPIVSLLIVLLIIKGSWMLFMDSFRLIIDGVPRGISLAEVRRSLEAEKGVQSVHDLHIWALSTQENALSVHLWMPQEPLTDESRHKLIDLLKTKHNIHHATVQVERDLSFCADACVLVL